MRKATLIFLFIALSLAEYEKVTMPQDRGAACLDGSPPIMFIDRGSEMNKDKYLVFIQGGGACADGPENETLENCYLRSFYPLGSSLSFDEADFRKTINDNGYLSTLPEVNPLFHDWTKVLIQYCDGFFHISNRSEPIQYKGKKLFFRGWSNMVEQFQYLEESENFYNKQKIVLTGLSSGGIATVFWANYLVKKTVTSEVLAIPDSGLYPFDYVNPNLQAPTLALGIAYLASQVMGPTNIPEIVQQCMAVKQLPMISCFNAEHLAQFMLPPTFYVQSIYDPTLPGYIFFDSISCINLNDFFQSLEDCDQIERKHIEDLRIYVINALKKMKGNRQDVGFWSPTCAQHGFLPYSFSTQPIAKIEGVNSVIQAVGQFLADPQNAKSYIVEDPWLANILCSGVEFTSVAQYQKLFKEFYDWKRYAVGKIHKN